MALQIAPTLPGNAAPQAAAPAPAEADEDKGFARLLQGETTRPEATDEDRPAADDPAATLAPLPAEADDAAAPLDPTLAHWLAGLHLPAPPDTPRPAGATAPVTAPSEDGSEALAAVGGAGSARPAGLRGPLERGAAEPRAGMAREPAAPTSAAAPGRPVAAAPEAHEAHEVSTPLAAASAEPAPRGSTPIELPATLNVGTPAPTPAPAAPLAAAAAPVEVPLAMGPADLGFGEAIATQVSVLARDGVQQAELHLNPSETGPVSVQIVLEGTQARIDFGADALPTRQAIENSLPELAAALREEGLTLSGGGVSEHARGRHEPPAEPAAGDASRRGAAAAEPAPAARSVPIARHAGGLDLYA